MALIENVQEPEPQPWAAPEPLPAYPRVIAARPEPLRVIAYLAEPPDMGSSRYRVLQYLPHFTAAGIQVVMSSPASDELYRRFSMTRSYWVKAFFYLVYFLRRGWDVMRAFRFDAVIVQRDLFPYGPPIFELLLRGLNRRILYDIDDANYARAPFAPRNIFQRARWQGKYRLMMRLSRRVATVNHFIAQVARENNGNVAIVPMALDVSDYQPGHVRGADGSRTESPVVIGWAGTRYSHSYLEQLEEPLAELSRRRHVVLHVVSGWRPASLRGVEVVHIPWSRDGEIAALRAFDIGLVPLGATDFDRGKFPLKMLQYMAVGLPVVASRIGTPAEILTDRVSGFLASTPREWLEALTALVDDPSLRGRVGRAGRAEFESHYSADAVGPAFVRELRAVATPVGAQAKQPLTRPLRGLCSRVVPRGGEP